MEHVNFQVERGTTMAILGGSGSGKSTLLRYLIGLERPQAGRIDIDGVGEPHRYEGVPPFGVLFQSGALFSSLTLAREPRAAADDLDADSRRDRAAISVRPSSNSSGSVRSPSICRARSRAA